MSALIHQLSAVILPVNVDQQTAELLQLRGCNRIPAHAAAAFPVEADTTLNDQLVLCLYIVFREPLLGIRQIEHRGYKAFFRPVPNQFPADTLAQHRTDGINDDGFTSAGLTGQDIQSGLELNIRFFDDGNILNMQFVQHAITSMLKQNYSRDSISA